MNANLDSPEFSPDPADHAVRHLKEAEAANPYIQAVQHLDEAEEWTDSMEGIKGEYVAKVNALIGIGWALLAIARKR